MKILLVCPKYRFEGYTPSGLASIASVAERLGHQVTVVDLNIQKLPKEKYDLVGVTGLSLWKQQIIRTVEAFKGTPVIVGGPWPSQMPLDPLRETSAKYVCVNEGEETFREFLQCYPNVEDVKGIGYKDKDGTHLNPARPFIDDVDSLPFPAWHLIRLDKYRRVSIAGSRGCPYNCIFCAVHVYLGRKWRPRSIESVMSEIELLVHVHKVKRITFGDSNLTLNSQRFQQICEVIIKRKIKVEFDVIQGVRADKLTPTLLEKMKKAGFVEVIIAPESGSQRVVNEVIHKRLDLSTVEPVVKKCKEIGLRCGAFFVIGFPWETMEEIEQTVKFAEKLRRLRCSAYVGNALPLFKTELYEKAKAEGFLRFDGKELEDNINSLGLPREVHCLTSPYWTPEQIIDICRRQHKKNLRSIYSHYSNRQIITKAFRHPVRAFRKFVRTL